MSNKVTEVVDLGDIPGKKRPSPFDKYEIIKDLRDKLKAGDIDGQSAWSVNLAEIPETRKMKRPRSALVMQIKGLLEQLGFEKKVMIIQRGDRIFVADKKAWLS